MPIPVRISQDFDASTRFSFLIHAGWIVIHLHHPEPAIRSPIEGHGICYLRLVGDQSGAESIRQLQGLQALFRSERRGHGQGHQVMNGQIHFLPIRCQDEQSAVLGMYRGTFQGWQLSLRFMPHFLRPAGQPAQIRAHDTCPEIDGLYFLIGIKKIGEAIAIQIGEAEPGIIDQPRGARKLAGHFAIVHRNAVRGDFHRSRGAVAVYVQRQSRSGQSGQEDREQALHGDSRFIGTAGSGCFG